METKNIYQAINAIMRDVDAVQKTEKMQGFMYRGIDNIMNAMKPLLAKHGVFVVPEILEQTREERTTKSGGNLIFSICKIKFIFYATDGSSVSAVTIGEGMDGGDKASNKSMSIAFKYALFQVFCIPTEEMKDPDAETPEPSEPKIKTLTDEQYNKILSFGVDIDSFAKYNKVESWADIPFDIAQKLIEQKERGAKK